MRKRFWTNVIVGFWLSVGAGAGCSSSSSSDGDWAGSVSSGIESSPVQQPGTVQEEPSETTSAVAEIDSQGFSEEERQLQLASFNQVWETIRDQHWDPTLGGLDWEAVRVELLPKVESAQTQDEVRVVLSDMIGRLGQSHFGILPEDVYEDVGGARMEAAEITPEEEGSDVWQPIRNHQRISNELPSSDVDASDVAPSESTPTDDDTTIDEAPSYEPGVTGIDVRVVDDVALVTAVDDRSRAHVLGIRPGWIVHEIDGDDVGESLKRIGDSYEHSSLREGMMSLAVQGMMERSAGGSASVMFVNGDDDELTIDVPSDPPPGSAVNFGHLPTMYLDFRQRMIEEDIGYFSFNVFFDPSTLMPAFASAVKSFSGAKGMIIDIRGNPGGIGGMAMGMAGRLVKERGLKLGTMLTRDSRLNFVINPQAIVFQGPVAVLVDGCSMSTSEIFAGGLQDIARARVFGTKTAGAALPSVITRLPNGDGFQYAIANYVSADGEPLEARGVEPDVVVKPDRAALLAGRDPVVDAAVAWIRETTAAKP